MIRLPAQLLLSLKAARADIAEVRTQLSAELARGNVLNRDDVLEQTNRCATLEHAIGEFLEGQR